MDTKPVFHGSDIEKICEYYNLKKEDIVNFGANVNPLGLSPHVKEAITDNLNLLFFLSGQRLYRPPPGHRRILRYSGGLYSSRQRFQRADCPSDRSARAEAYTCAGSYLFGILPGTFLFRKYPGILSPECIG